MRIETHPRTPMTLCGRLWRSAVGRQRLGQVDVGRQNVGLQLQRPAGMPLGRRRINVSQIAAQIRMRLPELGPDHRDTLESMSHLGLLYFRTGRLEEAERILLKSIDDKKRQRLLQFYWKY